MRVGVYEMSDRPKKIPESERLGTIALSKTGKSFIIHLVHGGVDAWGFVSRSSMAKVVDGQKYAVIRVVNFAWSENGESVAERKEWKV